MLVTLDVNKKLCPLRWGWGGQASWAKMTSPWAKLTTSKM